MTLTLYKGQAGGAGRQRLRRGAGRDAGRWGHRPPGSTLGLPAELDGRDVVAATGQQERPEGRGGGAAAPLVEAGRAAGGAGPGFGVAAGGDGGAGPAGRDRRGGELPGTVRLGPRGQDDSGRSDRRDAGRDPGRGCAGVRGPGHCDGFVWPPGAAGPGGQRAVCRDLAGDERHSVRPVAAGAGGVDHAGGAVRAGQRHAASLGSSEPTRWPGTRTWPSGWPTTGRRHRWRSPACSACGSCGWPWPRRLTPGRVQDLGR